MPQVRLQDQSRVSIFSCQKFFSLEIVVHIVFAIKGIFPKDLEPMLKFIPCLWINISKIPDLFLEYRLNYCSTLIEAIVLQQ